MFSIDISRCPSLHRSHFDDDMFPHNEAPLFLHSSVWCTWKNILIHLPLGYNMVLCSKCENWKLAKLIHSCFLRCFHTLADMKTPIRDIKSAAAESWKNHRIHGVSSKTSQILEVVCFILWHVLSERPWRFCWVLLGLSTTTLNLQKKTATVQPMHQSLRDLHWLHFFLHPGLSPHPGTKDTRRKCGEDFFNIACVRLFQHQNICF